MEIKDSSILNILGLSESTAMIVYMVHGAYFYNFKTQKVLGFVPNKHFNPFKCSVKKYQIMNYLLDQKLLLF